MRSLTVIAVLAGIAALAFTGAALAYLIDGSGQWWQVLILAVAALLSAVIVWRTRRNPRMTE